MVPGATKSSSPSHPDHPKLLDRHVRDMVNTITHRISGIPTNVGGSHPAAATDNDDDLQQHGVSVITLAGTNTGATMRGEFEQHSSNKGNYKGHNTKEEDEDQEEEDEDEDDYVGTYVNSNFQAVNNSIMLDSTYTTNDPGVHLDISDDNKLSSRRGKGNKNNNLNRQQPPSKPRAARRHIHPDHDASTSSG